ncbi:MAG: hypothetical protein R2883_02380 [Caldisericia bacterium]
MQKRSEIIFEASFKGDYEKAWSYILENSPMMELKGDLRPSHVGTWKKPWH